MDDNSSYTIEPPDMYEQIVETEGRPFHSWIQDWIAYLYENGEKKKAKELFQSWQDLKHKLRTITIFQMRTDKK